MLHRIVTISLTTFVLAIVAGGDVRTQVPNGSTAVDSAGLRRTVDSTSTARTLDLDAARRKLPRYMDAVEATLDPRMRKALGSIRDGVRRYLAIRGYVQREHRINTHWSWTAREAAAFRRTPEYRTMIDTINAVKRRFAMQNPGYRLEVSTDIRTLELQLRKWNTVASIAVAGREVADTSLIILADTSYPDTPDAESTHKFRAFLNTYELVNTPTVAVPGFSDHGQLRAFDFKVYKGRRLVAGTTTATIPSIWENPGWSCRLNDVICDYGDSFEGPLYEPYEPWHYVYRPGIVEARVIAPTDFTPRSPSPDAADDSPSAR